MMLLDKNTLIGFVLLFVVYIVGMITGYIFRMIQDLKRKKWDKV